MGKRFVGCFTVWWKAIGRCWTEGGQLRTPAWLAGSLCLEPAWLLPSMLTSRELEPGPSVQLKHSVTLGTQKDAHFYTKEPVLAVALLQGDCPFEVI